MLDTIGRLERNVLLEILDSLPSGVSIATDKSCKIIKHNAMAAKFLRIKSWDSFSHSADEPPTLDVFHHGKKLSVDKLPMQRAAWNGEEIYDFETELVWADGIRRIYTWNVRPLYKDGVLDGSIATWEDITDKKLQETMLAEQKAREDQLKKDIRQTEDRLKTAQQFAKFGFYEWDCETDELYWSDQVYSILGYAPGEITPTVELYMSHIHPADLEMVKNRVEQIRKDAFTYAQYRVFKRDGSLIWVNIIPQYTIGEDGVKKRVFAATQDITELKETEEELRKNRDALALSEARYRTLFEHMQNAFILRKVVLDKSGAVVDLEYIDVNPAWEKLVGKKAVDAIGKTRGEVFPGIPEKYNWTELLGNVALTGQPITVEEYSEITNGWYRVHAYSPEKGYVATITEDITDNKERDRLEKRYATELAATNNVLQATNDELKGFANSIAHDFRAPMVNLKGFTAELGYALDELNRIVHEEEVNIPDRVRDKIAELVDREMPDAQKFINSSVDRLSKLVDAMLNLARLGRREVVPKEVDLRKVVESILHSYNHQLEEKDIHIEIGTLHPIEADQMTIEQIIGNLLDNAIKYLTPDRPGIINIDSKVDEYELVVSIQDNGRGIAFEDQEKIFEVFRRAGKQDVPGDGMGLAYVKTLVRNTGGRVWCESEPGVGTKMSFTILIRQAASI